MKEKMTNRDMVTAEEVFKLHEEIIFNSDGALFQ